MRYHLSLVVVAIAMGLTACEPAQPPVVDAAGATPQALVPATAELPTGNSADAVSTAAPAEAVKPSGMAGYRLGSGDILRIRVFDEENLSGEFEVDGNGQVSMPLIGTVEALGLTSREFERSLQARLQQGYLLDPQVSVEVMNYRPFYIIGEVKLPGSYPYVNGMTVLNAVALAGGYTYRARTTGVTVKRAADKTTAEERDVPTTAPILPGDVITVQERYF